jgi:hypothetical protein
MKYLLYIITLFFVISCEDVIELPLENGPKRLVIDAAIKWKKGTSGSEQSIKLTETTGYYDISVPVVNGASVKITDATSEYIFTEQGTSGIYKTQNFAPVLNKEYTLTIIHNGETYSATEALKPVSDITNVVQKTRNILGEESFQIDFFYNDPADEENYYLVEFSSEAYYLNKIRTWDDELTNGNENSITEIDSELEKEDAIKLSFFGISKNFHNYVNVLLEQTENNGPFATPPATLNGNCINKTNSKNKPFGYFRLSEYVSTTYIIK